MTSDRFEPTDETTRRWKRGQRKLLVFTLPFAALVVLEIASFRGAGRLWSLAVTVFVAVALAAFLRSVGHLHHASDEILWSGYGYLSYFALRKAGLSESVTCSSEGRLRLWTAGRGVVGGRLEVRSDGLGWTFGFLARLAGVVGATSVPWTMIRNIQVGHVPGTLTRRSGGGISITLKEGGIIDGQFIGPSKELIQILSESPLARDPDGRS